MIACCRGLHFARGACRPASPVSGVHVSCLTDSPALARFRRTPILCVGCFGHTRSIHTNQDSSGLGRSRVRHVFQFQDFGIAEFACADRLHREVMLSSPNVHL